MRDIRQHKDTVARWLSGVLPAAILVLVGLFSVMTLRDYGRESDAARQTLLEKGSVLIRALESGSRVGMGMRMHHAQQQTLLEEMAGQPACCGLPSPMRRAISLPTATPAASENHSTQRTKCAS